MIKYCEKFSPNSIVQLQKLYLDSNNANIVRQFKAYSPE